MNLLKDKFNDTKATFTPGKTPGCIMKAMFIALTPLIFGILLAHAIVILGNFGERISLAFLTVGRDLIQDSDLFIILYSFSLVTFICFILLWILWTVLMIPRNILEKIENGSLSGPCPYCGAPQKIRGMYSKSTCQDCSNQIHIVSGLIPEKNSIRKPSRKVSVELIHSFFTEKSYEEFNKDGMAVKMRKDLKAWKYGNP